MWIKTKILTTQLCNIRKCFGYLAIFIHYFYRKARLTQVNRTIFKFHAMQDLDHIDRQLLRILQRDATLTNKELANQLDKSVATVHERVKKLKERGYILRTVAILDRKKIGKKLIAFSHVLLKEHTAQALGQFESQVAQFDQVMECYQMTGNFDFILRIACDDMDDYHIFLRNKLATLPNIVTVQSYFILSEPKSDTAYPI